MQRPQDAFERLFVPAVITGEPSAGAWQLGTRMIGGIGVQSLLQSSGGQPQSLPPRRHLHGFKIQIADGLTA
jgi:hypothetical protein